MAEIAPYLTCHLIATDNLYNCPYNGARYCGLRHGDAGSGYHRSNVIELIQMSVQNGNGKGSKADSCVGHRDIKVVGCI